MSKILFNIKNILLIVTIITTTVISNTCAKFIIERNEIGSDRFIRIDGFDEVKKDESTFKADGTCLDARRNIASAITDPTTRCYTNTEMKYIGTGNIKIPFFLIFLLCAPSRTICVLESTANFLLFILNIFPNSTEVHALDLERIGPCTILKSGLFTFSMLF